ncbi:MAG: hypothetical protein AAB671_01760 [Patescibacteria group bacterium]
MQWSDIKAHPGFYAGTTLSALVLGMLWFVAAWRFSVSEDFVPLHYTIYFGLDRFGPKYDLFLFPTLGAVILAVNLMVARTAFLASRLWQAVLMGLTFLMELVLLVSLVLAVLKGLS